MAENEPLSGPERVGGLAAQLYIKLNKKRGLEVEPCIVELAKRAEEAGVTLDSSPNKKNRR